MSLAGPPRKLIDEVSLNSVELLPDLIVFNITKSARA